LSALLDFFAYRRGWSVGSDTPPNALIAAEDAAAAEVGKRDHADELHIGTRSAANAA
jgi:hypothetical protein